MKYMRKKADFFTLRQSEELFVRGISEGVDEEGISQAELIQKSKKILGQIGRNVLADNQISTAEEKGEIFHHWYAYHDGPHRSERTSVTYGHTEIIRPGNFYDCDLATDEWFEWFLTTPPHDNPYSNPGDTGLYETENVFLMQNRNTAIYFTTVAPFQSPDVKSITLTKKAPLLVPVYNAFASEEMFPSLISKDKQLVSVISDLFGIRINTVSASIDGQTIEPCCVIRKKPWKIEGIPADNVIGIPADRVIRSHHSVNIVHGGFWMLIRPEALTSGDHLLEFKVESVNYKMDAHIRINVLV